MSFVAPIEADISNFDSNLSKASKIMNNFAAQAQKGVDGVKSSFSKLNGGLIGGLQNKISSLKSNLENATDIKSVVKYNLRIQEAQKELERLKNLGIQASSATKNIINPLAAKSADSLSSSLKRTNSVSMEFNRIIQDAPFGMIGITNNLTQLVDNYKSYAMAVRQAAVEQGKSISNFQIFKGAISGILSPINLATLGFSLLTSGIVMYQMWQQKASKATKESTDKFKELVDNLNNVSSAMYDAAKSSGAEASELRVLYSITQDVTKSTHDREKAASDLIKQYPALFGKFTEEQVLLGKAKLAYDKVSASIIATARAQAAFGRIGEKSSLQFAIDETNRSLQKEISLLDAAIKRQESLTSAGKGAGAVSETIESANVSKLNRLYEDRKRILDQVTNNLLERAKLQVDINELEGVAISNQSNIIDLEEKGDKAKKGSIKTLSEYKAELVDLFAGFGYYDSQMQSITNKFNGFRDMATKAGASAKEFARIAREELGEKLNTALNQFSLTGANSGISGLSAGLTIPISLKVDEKATTKAISDLGLKSKEALEKLTDDINKTLELGLETALIDVSAAIGEALMGGGNVLDNAGKALLGALGSVMVQLGKMAITAGIGIEAIKEALTSLNPYVAIAAGAALVAIGSMFSAGAKNLGNSMGKASGGGYTSSAIKSSYTPIDQSKRMAIDISGTLKAEGKDLRLVLTRENATIKRTS